LKSNRLAQGDAFPIELDSDECTLGFYGIRDGSEILMDMLDSRSSEREESRKCEKDQRQMSEQERTVSHIQELERRLRGKGLL
jgi:hypothetical protein